MLGGLEDKQDNDLMRIQLREYIEFIHAFTEEVDVVSKNFFVVIPYTPAKINFTKGINNLFSKPQYNEVQTSESQFDEHRIQLEQRVGIVTEGLARIGVRTIPLQKDDLVELYYHIYNPSDLTGNAPQVNYFDLNSQNTTKGFESFVQANVSRYNTESLRFAWKGNRQTSPEVNFFDITGQVTTAGFTSLS